MRTHPLAEREKNIFTLIYDRVLKGAELSLSLVPMASRWERHQAVPRASALLALVPAAQRSGQATPSHTNRLQQAGKKVLETHWNQDMKHTSEEIFLVLVGCSRMNLHIQNRTGTTVGMKEVRKGHAWSSHWGVWLQALTYISPSPVGRFNGNAPILWAG